jgi:hypothetical protein
MPFGIGGFNSASKQNFNGNFSKGLGEKANFTETPKWELDTNAFKFTPSNNQLKSRIRFYDHDSLWSRWRRGYELYTITQSVLGSFSNERKNRGDYRVYCTFQQFPGVFIPARVMTFPSVGQETGEQIVGIRDTNGFNFYNFGLPILAVRYLGGVVSTTYQQTGTTIVVSKEDHGLLIGENVYLDFLSGAGIDETLPVVSSTQNTFTVTASSPATTSGNVNYYLSTTFLDVRWTTTRVRLRSIPSPVNFFAGERLADRVVERDPGIVSTYSRTADIVTVTCSEDHGLSSGNKVFVDVTSGAVDSGQYIIVVTSSTNFTFETIDSGSSSGGLILSRLIEGYRYDDYVAYTVSGLDATTNEIIFQRDDSYGTTTSNQKSQTVVPAQRGFEVGRFLTTDVRWQCSCQDYQRRSGYNLFSKLLSKRFPVTAITSTKPGEVDNKDGSISNERDIPGSFSDLGYITVNNFYNLPTYKDTKEFSYPNLMYYQLRWCKHIYAAMFSMVHDEGNQPISFNAKYAQSGPNITVNAPDHNLTVNSKIQLDFTSGSTISGQYTITSVLDKDNFVVIYPFSNTSSGYCTVSNLKTHEFVGAWLLEPNDRPVGDDLDTFYSSFDKETKQLKLAAERLAITEQGTKWIGNKSIIGSGNQPEEIANYDPQLITMLITDSIRRGSDDQLDRDGIPVNTSNRMLATISKLFNLGQQLIKDTKIGIVTEPLVNFPDNFEFGLIEGGRYRNGNPIESADEISILDCSTYSPLTAQDTVVDGGLYINT